MYMSMVETQVIEIGDSDLILADKTKDGQVRITMSDSNHKLVHLIFPEGVFAYLRRRLSKLELNYKMKKRYL